MQLKKLRHKLDSRSGANNVDMATRHHSRFRACAVCAVPLAAFMALGAFSAFAPAHAASPIPSFAKPQAGTQMQMRSNSIDYDKTGRVAVATGNVVITYGGYTLTADRVRYNRRTKVLAASGNVQLREPGGTIFKTDTIELSDTFSDAFATNLSVLLTNEAVLTAQTVKREAGNVSTYTKATYTRCKACVEDPSKPLVWRIKADKITHNKQERTLAYEGASFEFMGHELINIPKFSHADPTVSRKTGFLAPSLQTADQFGFGVEIPFFWNIAPNQDLTFRPVLTSKQGPIASATWRHRLFNGQYSVTPTGVYQFTDDSETPSKSRFRGSIATKGKFVINKNWRWGWNAKWVSDDTFLRRYDIDNETDITSQIYLTGLDDRNYFSVRGYHFRGLLATDVNRRDPYVLPSVDHNYFFGSPIIGGELGMDTSFRSLQRDSGPTSTRLVTNLHWQRQMVTRIGAVVTPFASLRGDVYFENNVIDPTVTGGIRGREDFARALPMGGVDIRMPMVRTHAGGHQQIFEPIAQILIRPNETKVRKISNEDSLNFEFEETNLFDFSKFSGVDRWEGGTRANVGFNHTLLFSNGNYLKFTVGESFQLYGKNSYGVDTGLETDRSDFVTALQFKPSQHLNFTGRARFDEKTAEIKRIDISTTAHYGRLNTLIYYTNADARPALGQPGHREEIYAEAGIQVSKYWNLFGKMRFDLQENDRVSNAVGVKYDDECFVFHVQYKENFTRDRDVDINRSVMFKFELKTISSSGS